MLLICVQVNGSTYNEELMEAMSAEVIERVNDVRAQQGRSKFEISAAAIAGMCNGHETEYIVCPLFCFSRMRSA